MENAGTILIFVGILGRALSTITIGGKKNTEVIDTELYSIIRHPLYFFSFLMTLGISLYTERIEIVLLSIFLFFICFYPMMLNEENFLTEKFGNKYKDYMKGTFRFFPNFKKWEKRDHIEINFNLLLRTIADVSVVLIIMMIMEIADRFISK